MFDLKNTIQSYLDKNRARKKRIKALVCMGLSVAVITTSLLTLPGVSMTVKPDYTADVETEADWEEMFKDLKLSGNYAADLLTVAKTQIGYKESTKNFIYDGSSDSAGSPEDIAQISEVLEDNAALTSSADIEKEISSETVASESEAVTEAPTESATEAATEAPTEPTAESATKPATEAATEAPTEAPTEKVTEPATEAPTEPATEASPERGGVAEGDGGVTSDEAETSYAKENKEEPEGETKNKISETESENVAETETIDTETDYGDTGSILGYSRYGAWYGIPYGHWCAMFISFCLNYAEVPTDVFPIDAGCQNWINKVSTDEYNYYHSAESGYIPSAGDLIFFDWYDNNYSDHIGIVIGLSEESASSLSAEDREEILDDSIDALINDTGIDDADSENNSNYITVVTLEGNSSDMVTTRAYSLDYSCIMGYAEMPGYTYDGLSNALSRLYDEAEGYADQADGDELTALCEDALARLCTMLEAALALYEGEEISEDEYGALETLAENILALLSEYGFDPYGTETVSADNTSLGSFAIVCVSLDAALDNQTVNDTGDIGRNSNNGNNLAAISAAASAPDGGYQSGVGYVYTSEDKVEELKSQIQIWTVYSDADLTQEVTSVSESQSVYIATVINGTTYYIAAESGNTSYPVLSTEPYQLFLEYSSSGAYGGMFRIKISESGNALNLYGGTKDSLSNGFGLYNDSGSGEWFVLATVAAKEFATVSGTTPIGTVINLFDYWTTEQWPEGGDFNETGEENKGINENRTLVFSNPSHLSSKGWNWNKATGDSNYINLMEKTLGSDNYPKLNTETISAASGSNSADVTDGYSLGYLFNPDYANSCRETFSKVQDLFQIDSDGYYYYNSQENYAEYDGEANAFILYQDTAVGSGQFFPFNDIADAYAVSSSQDASLNHYFGLTLTDRFEMANDGYTDENHQKPMIFEFSGDDDVWIYIDGVLVADLGGIHNVTGVSIDFSNGSITYKYNGSTIVNSGSQNGPTTIKAQFEAAGADGSTAWSGNTFADSTYHTLQFFYMERGNYDSNLYIKYNLTSINATSLYKVDQYGDALAGAGFAVYAADADYHYYADNGTAVDLAQCSSYSVSNETGVITAVMNGATVTITPKYTGYSDSAGEMIFVDKYGSPLSTTELKALFGDHFILREFDVPNGYRPVSEEVYLEFDGGKFLVCENVFESGALSSVGSVVTATETLYKASGVSDGAYTGDPISYYSVGTGEHTGTLFAVVLKKNGSTGGPDTWYPVSGSSDEGYTVSSSTAEDLAAVIAIARSYGDARVFSAGDSGRMQLAIDDLPGSITEYYTYNQMMMETYSPSECLAKSEYFIAYYYTTADSLEGATADNTCRVISREGIMTGYNGFGYDIASTISITNMENRVYLYKLDADDDYIENAVFALYPVGEDSDENLYYVADDGTLVYLDADADGDNMGTAHIGSSAGTKGTYVISTDKIAERDTGLGLVTGEGAGVITVTAGEAAYTISPVKNATGNAMVAYTHTECSYGYNSDGATGHFTKLLSGTYAIREIYAPDRFLLNTTEVRVLITDLATYADAGTADDGVVVGKGAGYLANSLHAMASEGDLNQTLSWIYALLQKTGTGVSFSELLANETHTVSSGSLWQYGVSSGDAMSDNDTTTSEKSESIVTYLEYDYGNGNAIFDYVPNAAYTKTGTTSGGATWNRDTADGVNSRRIWTDTGWSYLAIYQDYEYGSKVVSGSTGYSKLDGSGADDGVYNTTTYGSDGEISNLFSRSTYVGFYDEITVDLEIEKVGEETGEALSGASFRLYKMEGDISGEGSESGNGSNGNGSGDENGGTGSGEDNGTGTDSGRLYYYYDEKYGLARWTDDVEKADILSTTSAVITGASASGTTNMDPGETGASLSLADTITLAVGNETINNVSVTWTYTPETLSGTWTATGTMTLPESCSYSLSEDAKLAVTLTYDEEASGTERGTAAATLGYQTIHVYGLAPGTYYLEEVTAPIGYLILSGPVTIVVDEYGIVTMTYGDTTYYCDTATGSSRWGVAKKQGSGMDDDGLSWQAIDPYTYVLTISNTSGYELPATGGMGTKLLYALGIMMVLGAGVVLVIRRKMKTSE